MRSFGAVFVSSELRRVLVTAAISSTAATNASSLAFDGLLKPLTLRTNCNEAARISSSVTGGAKLKRILMFLHISFAPMCDRRLDRHAALQGTRRILTRAPAGSASRPSGAPDVHWTGGKRVRPSDHFDCLAPSSSSSIF